MTTMRFVLPGGECVPGIDVAQMRAVDAARVADFHIELAQMMEHAGRNLADLARGLFSPRSATVLAGPGENDGGGLVAARHLHNRRIAVTVTLASRHVAPVTALQLDIVERLGVEVRDEPRPADVIIAVLVGYGLSGDPGARFAELIDWANATSAPVLALDTRSGSGDYSAPVDRERHPRVDEKVTHRATVLGDLDGLVEQRRRRGSVDPGVDVDGVEVGANRGLPEQAALVQTIRGVKVDPLIVEPELSCRAVEGHRATAAQGADDGLEALPVPSRLTDSSVTSDRPSRVVTTVRTPSSLQARSVVQTGLGPCLGVLSTAGLGSTVLTMRLTLLMRPGPGSP